MYQIKVNGILLPEIYWSQREAFEACYREKKTRNCRSDRGNSIICKLGKRMGSTKLIRYLNDRFRSTFQGGQVVLTRGIRALPQEEITEILSKVSNFNDFNSDNDPYFEHDGSAFEYNGMKIIWKIDYYDKEYEYASEDPADITKTNRVLTVMLADEY